MYCSNMLELKPIELFRGLIYQRWIAINPAWFKILGTTDNSFQVEVFRYSEIGNTPKA